MRNLFIALTLAIALVGAAFATGAKLAGTWKAMGGATISIPNTPGDFDLVVKHTDGHKDLLKGHWTDRTGTQFWFINDVHNRINCFYDPKKDQIRTVNPKGDVGYWIRVK